MHWVMAYWTIRWGWRGYVIYVCTCGVLGVNRPWVRKMKTCLISRLRLIERWFVCELCFLFLRELWSGLLICLDIMGWRRYLAGSAGRAGLTRRAGLAGWADRVGLLDYLSWSWAERYGDKQNSRLARLLRIILTIFFTFETVLGGQFVISPVWWIGYVCFWLRICLNFSVLIVWLVVFSNVQVSLSSFRYLSFWCCHNIPPYFPPPSKHSSLYRQYLCPWNDITCRPRAIFNTMKLSIFIIHLPSRPWLHFRVRNPFGLLRCWYFCSFGISFIIQK